jgi:putative transposase
MIAGFKGSVTSRTGRELDIENIWQRNYYEHIVRDDEEFHQIYDDIQTNPLHWLEDQWHPCASPNHFNQE